VKGGDEDILGTISHGCIESTGAHQIVEQLREHGDGAVIGRRNTWLLQAVGAERNSEQLRVRECKCDIGLTCGAEAQPRGLAATWRNRSYLRADRLNQLVQTLNGDLSEKSVLVGEVVIRSAGAHSDLGCNCPKGDMLGSDLLDPSNGGTHQR
jgi:hypothetical protein